MRSRLSAISGNDGVIVSMMVFISVSMTGPVAPSRRAERMMRRSRRRRM